VLKTTTALKVQIVLMMTATKPKIKYCSSF